MATLEIKEPSILLLEFWQEEDDQDYGSCLWGRFYFDKENYALTIESDCGAYSYGWTPTPNSESFLKLMLRIDEGYLLNKISSLSEVDEIKTLENIKELIATTYGYHDVDFSKVIKDKKILEYDLDQIESACNARDQREVAETLLSALESMDDELEIDEYDLYQSIEKDYPCGAKKIVSIFINFIQPKIKEIIREG